MSAGMFVSFSSDKRKSLIMKFCTRKNEVYYFNNSIQGILLNNLSDCEIFLSSSCQPQESFQSFELRASSQFSGTFVQLTWIMPDGSTI